MNYPDTTLTQVANAVQQAVLSGRVVKNLTVILPQSATQGQRCMIAMEYYTKRNAGDGLPIITVMVIA